MDDATLQSIRALVDRRHIAGSTHYHGCVGDHVDCALTALLADVDRLRDGITRHRDRKAEPRCYPKPGHEGKYGCHDHDLRLWALIGGDDA